MGNHAPVLSPAVVRRLCLAVALAVCASGLSPPAVGSPAVPGAAGQASAVPGAAGQASAGRGPGRPAECDDPVLDVPRHGADAVRALGRGLTSVAARAGRTGRELAELIRADRTLWIDPCGVPFYSDELPANAEPQLSDMDSAALPDTVAPADAFRLHSRPGASRVIFLDFDGHVVTGTGWNARYGQDPIIAPPLSTDGDPAFTDGERALVIDVWRRVAQDYAPFDVDVTTQDPGESAITRSGSGDLEFGTRVLISPDSTQAQCGCAGRAYLNVFDRPSGHAYYQPAWVYPHVLSNNSKYVAEAVSHEAGHVLSLSHDGAGTSPYYSGSSGWGPIMGSPYAQAVTQWSAGDYADATNVEDDVALIADAGAPLQADDVPDSADSAISLATPAVVTGLIGSAADVDVFTVTTAGGALHLAAEPNWPGPNLDLSVRVTQVDGTQVASSAPAFSILSVRATVGASLDIDVPPGTYVVSVDGTGNGIAGSPGESDYGSVGWYTLTVTEDAAPSPSESPNPGPSPSESPNPAPSPSESLTPGPSPSPTQTTSSTGKGEDDGGPPAKVEKTATATATATATGAVLTESADPLGVTTRRLPSAKRTRPYSAVLQASGGTAPYTWKRIKRKLPKGLRLSTSGELHGKPKVRRRTVKFKVRVTDAAGAGAKAWVRLRVRR